MTAAMPSKTDPPRDRSGLGASARGRVEIGGQDEELFVVPRRASTPNVTPALSRGPFAGTGNRVCRHWIPAPRIESKGGPG